MSPPKLPYALSIRLLISATAITGLLLVMTACSSKVGVTPGCNPGEIARCDCPSGESGFQECQQNNEYGPCECTIGDAGEVGEDDVTEDVPDDTVEEETGPPPTQPPSFANISVAGGAVESDSFRLRFSITSPLNAQESTTDNFNLRSTIVVGTTP